jgi:exoribonuclease II
MEIGRIVAFFDQKKLLLGVCLEARENRVHLLSEENRELTLGSNRIVHSSSAPLKTSLPRETLVESLKKTAEKQTAHAREVALAELWEVFNPEGRGLPLRELSELVFPPRPSWDQEMAVLRVLFEDRLYFKQKGDLFEPRSPEKVEEIGRQLTRQAEAEREMEEAAAWIAGVWADRPAPPPAKKEAVFSLLKEYALFGAEAPEASKAKDLLERAKIQAPNAAFDLLVRLGEWGEDENLFLLRHRIPQTFGGNVLNEVGEILLTASGSIPLHPQDRDLTFLHPLTIDSEYTRDVDDALSLETSGGELQIGIHITDVATFLNGRKEIFAEARQRGISIYLPEQRIPMIPPAMSEGVCSLIVGEKRRALSFLVKFDEGGKVRDFQIVPSIIQVERRLSYEAVDRLLEEGEDELSRLHAVAEKLFERRMEAGAFFIPRPERVIRVSREKEISILKRERESPSQKMVSEFMILANCLAASFLKEKGIPAIYRSQMEPREKIPPIDRFDPVQAYRLRRVMNRVEFGTRPSRHAGLGAEAYVTLTSPIRRFYDLLVEGQILSALRGAPLWTQAEMEGIITEVGPTLSKVGLVEEMTERYWVLRFLEKRPGSTAKGVILDRFPNRYLVHLSEYLMEVDMPVVSGRSFEPGDQLLVRLEKAHARSGLLKIAPL